MSEKTKISIENSQNLKLVEYLFENAEKTDNFQRTDENKLKLINSSKFELDENFEKQNKIEKNALLVITKEKKFKIIQIPDYFLISKKLKKGKINLPDKFQKDLDYREQKELMVKEIGTNKSKKIMKNYKMKDIKNQGISSISEINNVIKKKTFEIEEDGILENANRSQKKLNKLKKILPPFNISGKNYKTIYKLEGILNEKDLEKINLEKIKEKIISKKFLNPFVKEIIIENNIDNENDDKILKSIAFLDFMLKILPLRKINKNIIEICKEKRIPFFIGKKIIKLFFDSVLNKDKKKIFVQTKISNLKFLSYIIILSLLVSGNKMNIRSFLPYSRMIEKDLFNLCKECGCVLMRKNDKVYVRIKKIKIN